MNLQIKPFSLAALICALCSLLGACAQPYSVTLNNNVVYTPNASLRDAVTQDPGLQACLDLTLERTAQTDPASITLLACPGAGVETLAGIEALVNLEQLEHGDNQVSSLSPLIPLKKLRVLGLRNNRVGDLRPLEELPILRFLSLEGNNGIPCRHVDVIAARLGNTVGRPESCID
jgi:hypothetical protein